MTTQPMIKLADGNIMPQLGLGVWQATHDQMVAAVTEALQASTLPRDQLFITTKLWNTDQSDPQKALEESLQKLRLDFVDLYLIHWPVPDQDTYVDAWRGLLRLQEQGLVKSIGVSNFHSHHLQRLECYASDSNRVLESAGTRGRRGIRATADPSARTEIRQNACADCDPPAPGFWSGGDPEIRYPRAHPRKFRCVRFPSRQRRTGRDRQAGCRQTAGTRPGCPTHQFSDQRLTWFPLHSPPLKIAIK